jgi:hypothetical protein
MKPDEPQKPERPKRQMSYGNGLPEPFADQRHPVLGDVEMMKAIDEAVKRAKKSKGRRRRG